MNAASNLGFTLLGMLRDVLPIAVILVGFQTLVLRQPLKDPARLALGVVFVLVGLTLFLEGLSLALFPIGRLMAQQLTDPAFLHGTEAGQVASTLWLDYGWVYAFGAAIGFSTAIAEPALMAVAMKVNAVSGGTVTVLGLRVAVAVGAGLGVTIGVFRIISGYPLHWFIIAGYVLVIIQTALAPRQVIPLAYDSGGVTTSTVTVPLVAALGLGLAESIPGRSPLLDGFGLIAFTALFPILAVMGYAQLSQWRLQRLANKTQRAISGDEA